MSSSRLTALASAALLCLPLAADDKEDVAKRLKQSATVLAEIMKQPNDSIPEDILDEAECAVVVPGLKSGGFIISGQYGKGFMTCRKADRLGWTAPAAVKVEGGGIGLQAGGQETDLVLMVMNKSGKDHLMSSQFTLGAEGGVAAGPLGRRGAAKTDAKFRAEILSWSRSRGAFAGISLEGSTLREDKDANEAMYGKEMTTREVIEGNLMPPPDAALLLHQLTASSPQEGDDKK